MGTSGPFSRLLHEGKAELPVRERNKTNHCCRHTFFSYAPLKSTYFWEIRMHFNIQQHEIQSR